jgi:hypothetical protein
MGQRLMTLPAHLVEAPVAEWFDQRVRPLIGAEGLTGSWQGAAERLGDADLQLVAESLRERDGLPARAALTMLAGWTAGYVAWLIGIGVLRDGVLVRASAPSALRVLRHSDGYYFDARLARPCAAVAPDHPWASRPDVGVVTADLEVEALREITRVCEPILEPIARQSGRGRHGLWAQVADSLADAASTLHAAEPTVDAATAMAAVESLLGAADAPWRHRPRLWLADAGGEAVLVKHRGSCCLYYRREGADAPAELSERYCDTCLFRQTEDVETRVLSLAESERTS